MFTSHISALAYAHAIHEDRLAQARTHRLWAAARTRVVDEAPRPDVIDLTAMHRAEPPTAWRRAS